MIYEYFRATGACEAEQDLSDLFNIRWQNDNVQDFDTRRDQVLLAASEIPTEMVLEGFFKSKLQDSVQFQTVLATYEQENVRNNEPPSYSRLKTIVRRHIDQTMRTRNFRARNEMVERGAVTKSQKGRKASVDRKVGECYQWKATGQCSRGDSCSFSHDRASGNRCDQRQGGQSSSLAPKSAGTQWRKETLKKFRSQRGQPFWNKEQEAEVRADTCLGESVRTRHVITGTFPCVSITSLNLDAHMAKNAESDTLRPMCNPVKSRRKVVWRN